jgi:hypothetical protein
MRTEYTASLRSANFVAPRVSRPTFEVSFERLDRLKSLLKRELREVKHTHRLEALARGLGWNTYDDMRAEVFEYTPTAKMDGKAFTQFLASKGHPDVHTSILENALRRSLREVTQVAERAGGDIGHVTDIVFRR